MLKMSFVVYFGFFTFSRVGIFSNEATMAPKDVPPTMLNIELIFLLDLISNSINKIILIMFL